MQCACTPRWWNGLLAQGAHANFSSGVASASAINCWETCLHSPSYPCQIPSGGAEANTMGVLNKNHSKNVFNKHVFTIQLLLIAVAMIHLENDVQSQRIRLRPGRAESAWHKKDLSPFTKIMHAEITPQEIMIRAIHMRAPSFFSSTLLGTSKKK
jgi:hypothetical protein